MNSCLFPVLHFYIFFVRNAEQRAIASKTENSMRGAHSHLRHDAWIKWCSCYMSIVHAFVHRWPISLAMFMSITYFVDAMGKMGIERCAHNFFFSICIESLHHHHHQRDGHVNWIFDTEIPIFLAPNGFGRSRYVFWFGSSATLSLARVHLILGIAFDCSFFPFDFNLSNDTFLAPNEKSLNPRATGNIY